MRDLLSKMGRHGLAFSVSLLLSRLVGFVLMPFLTAKLAQTDYGVLDNLALVGQLVALVAAQGVPSALFRGYAFSARGPDEKRAVIATGFRYTALSTVVLAGVLALFAGPVAHTAAGDPRYGPLFVLVLLTYVFGNLKNVCGQILRADYRSREFLFVYCGEFILCVALNIWFVLVLETGLAGIIYSNLIGSAAAFLFSIYFVPQVLTPAFDRKLMRGMLGFGLPLVPPALALFFLDSVDRLFFRFLLGPEDGVAMSGLYGRGVAIATILQGVLVLPFTTLWPSIYYPLGKRPSAAQDLGRCASYYAAGACFLAVGLTAVARPLVSVMTDVRYHEAWQVVPILAFSLVLFGFSDITKVGMFIAGRTRALPLIVIVAVAVNCLLNLLLIPRLGLTAAAWSSLCAYATLAFLGMRASQRHFRVDFEWPRLAKVGAVAAVCLVLHRWTPGLSTGTIPERLIDLVLHGAAAALLFPLLLYATGFFTAREREVAVEKVRGWLKR